MFLIVFWFDQEHTDRTRVKEAAKPTSSSSEMVRHSESLHFYRFFIFFCFDLCAQGLWASDFYGLGHNLTGHFRVKSSFWTTQNNEILYFSWRMWEYWRSRQTCRPDYAVQQVRSLILDNQLKVLKLYFKLKYKYCVILLNSKSK